MSNNNNQVKIGDKLRKLRVNKGYSQESMAETLQISQKTYSNMENDKSSISIENLKKIAEEFNVDLLELLSDGKVIVQYNTANDSSTFNGVVNNNVSEELIIQLKERIEDLKIIIDEKSTKISQLEKLL
ncbi:helix-turn-helix transcriptional regulator [Flavobacterium sp.]|uniref:helix-turn-helix domain-containing protein n=1 Tax=Flavobacterium sp. TaxID=239 RepID=UPI0033409B5B